MEFRNGCRMRMNNNKPGPSGMSRNHAFALPEQWGGKDCLLKIEDLSVITELKESLGGEALLAFSTTEFMVCAQNAYDSLDITELTFENVWNVFTAMLPLAFAVDIIHT